MVYNCIMNVRRLIYDRLIREAEKPFISILIGPRQVGKTFLLRQIEKACIRRKLKTSFYNLENPKDLQYFAGSEEEVVSKLQKPFDIIFIDEFHYLKNATKLFKIIYDSKSRVKIFASGSSSMEIHKHLKESLAGRYRLSIIYPLFHMEEKQIPDHTLDDYLKFGGLPGLIHEELTEDKMTLLQNILATYLQKDIKSLIKEENVRAYNHLLYSLAQSQGSTVPFAGLAREVGLSEPAVKYHLELMAHTHVCYPLESFSRNLANELKKARKYYLYDIGMRNSILNDFSSIKTRQDKGVIIESFVFLSIIKQLKVNMELKFWRTRQGDEVDFILLKNRIPVPVEVKYSITDRQVPGGMQKFLLKYKEAPHGIIISKGGSGEIVFDNRPIKLMDWHETESIEYLQSVE